MKGYSILGASAVVLMSMSSIAHAQCSLLSDGAGSTVSCSTSGTGYFDDDDDNVIITVDEGVVIDDDGGMQGKAIRANDNSSVTVSGTVTSADGGIELGDQGTVLINSTGRVEGGMGIAVDVGSGGGVGTESMVTNNGVVVSGGDGIRNRQSNFVIVINNGTINTTGGDGININDDTQVTNTGTITAVGEAIDVDDRSVIVNSGTINATARAINALDDLKLINDGDITSSSNDGVHADANADITNNGTITALDSGEDGITFETGTVVNNGSINAGDAGISATRQNVSGAVTITNYGTISGGADGEGNAIDGRNNKTVTINNYGALISVNDEAVELGNGDDTFNWYSGSSVSGGAVDLGGDTAGDTVNVLSVSGFETADFVDVENFNIAHGVAAISEETASGEYTLYTADEEVFDAVASNVGALSSDLTQRILVAGGAGGAGLQSAGDGWWILAYGSAQDDRGAGYGLSRYNVAIGREFGSFDVFLGLENVDVDVSSSANALDQQLLYAGLVYDVALSPVTTLSTMGVVGMTRTDFNVDASTAEADGTFASISARLNHEIDGKYEVGGYIGAASYKSDAVSVGSLAFGEQQSISTFAGLDFKGEAATTSYGGLVRPIVGVGMINGDAATVTMTGGSTTIAIAGDDADQRFWYFGASHEYNGWYTSANVRLDPGSYRAVDVTFKKSF